MKTERYVSTLSAAVMAIAAERCVISESSSATKTDDAVVIEPRTCTAATKTNLLTTIGEAAYSVGDRFTTRINRNSGWLERDESQYADLVMKEALSSLSENERDTLEALQNRRRTLVKVSGEEILERYRRQKLDQELLAVLQRYVHIVPHAATHSA